MLISDSNKCFTFTQNLNGIVGFTRDQYVTFRDIERRVNAIHLSVLDESKSTNYTLEATKLVNLKIEFLKVLSGCQKVPVLRLGDKEFIEATNIPGRLLGLEVERQISLFEKDLEGKLNNALSYVNFV